MWLRPFQPPPLQTQQEIAYDMNRGSTPASDYGKPEPMNQSFISDGEHNR